MPCTLYSHNFDVYFIDGTVKHCIYKESTQELTIDHINKAIERIETDLKNEDIRKVIFSFVSIDHLTENVWNLLTNCKILKMNFCKCENLNFVKKLPSIQVFAMQESNIVKKIDGLDFSYNKELEYLELEDLNINITKDIKFPKSIKYIVICYSKINIEGYDKIQKALKKNTRLVLDLGQKDFVTTDFLLAESELIKLWKKYEVD